MRIQISMKPLFVNLPVRDIMTDKTSDRSELNAHSNMLEFIVGGEDPVRES